MKKKNESLVILKNQYEKLVYNTCVRASERFNVTGKTSFKPEEAATDVMNDVLFVIANKYLLPDGSLPLEGFPIKLFQALAKRKASNIYRAKYRNRYTKPFFRTEATYESMTDFESEKQIDLKDSADDFQRLISNDILHSLSQKLDTKERQVLTMYQQGEKVKDMASFLGVDPRTIRNIRYSISTKLANLER
ncbi:RNA polymerase sigma factor [Alteromonas stellipolaris]|uniref:RNA polymerase sigma factor n=1 Tax=Alteromonas stellipolaris TaxID=233316 RepID=UPI0024953FD6|nr:LuxR C-terminal-related transcriptional regulator [Alteromonas stellipolaris]